MWRWGVRVGVGGGGHGWGGEFDGVDGVPFTNES